MASAKISGTITVASNRSINSVTNIDSSSEDGTGKKILKILISSINLIESYGLDENKSKQRIDEYIKQTNLLWKKGGPVETLLTELKGNVFLTGYSEMADLLFKIKEIWDLTANSYLPPYTRSKLVDGAFIEERISAVNENVISKLKALIYFLTESIDKDLTTAGSFNTKAEYEKKFKQDSV